MFLNEVLNSAVCIALICCVCKCSPMSNDSEKLVQINVIFRHGSRTPGVPFPNTSFPKPIVPYELTNTGKLQSYNLGEVLKSRYIDGSPFSLLSQDYNSTQIQVNSSMTSRTMGSAYCLLAGLYPPQDEQIWNPDLLWQPIPVYTIDLKEDHVLPSLASYDGNCDGVNELRQTAFKDMGLGTRNEEYKDFFDYLDEKAGYDVNISNVWQIFDNLVLEKEEDLLSSWASEKWKGNKTVYEELFELFKLSFESTFLYGDLKKFGGFFIQEVFSNMNAVGETDVKAFFYSSHEDRIGSVLSCFNLYTEDSISFVNVSSVLVFELYNVNGQHSLKLAYKDGHAKDFKYLIIPGCSSTELCSFDELKEIAGPCLSADWEKLCSVSSSHRKRSTVAAGIVGSVLLVCVVFAAIMIWVVICRKKEIRTDYHSMN